MRGAGWIVLLIIVIMFAGCLDIGLARNASKGPGKRREWRTEDEANCSDHAARAGDRGGHPLTRPRRHAAGHFVSRAMRRGNPG